MSFHLYADDTQLYATFSIDDEDSILHTKENIEACLNDIMLWMTENMLSLNSQKTELMVFKSKHQHLTVSPTLSVKDHTVKSKAMIRNLGISYDCNLSMANHVAKIVKSSFYHLKNISRIRKYITIDTAKTLVHTFISSKLDYCNALLYGLPKSTIRKLQSVQNSAARIVMRMGKYDHITPVLEHLHWLPIEYRIEFKICLLVYKVLHNLAPEYLGEARALRSSMDMNILKEKRFNVKTYGSRAFSVAGPKLWNKLPNHIRSCLDINIFKSKLKTLLFKQAFNCQ